MLKFQTISYIKIPGMRVPFKRRKETPEKQERKSQSEVSHMQLGDAM